MTEHDILEQLDAAVRSPRAQRTLADIAGEVERMLLREPESKLAWRTVSLGTYDGLPDSIASSWIFALRANITSGAERHPNSIQRFMSFKGTADMQTWEGGRWKSNVLSADASLPLEQRWLAIPLNVWHRPVMQDMHWVVVSFHTASDDTLIEELAADDEQPDAGSRAAEPYSGRVARW